VRICVAPDKFKGSLSAPHAARLIAAGLQRKLADARIDCVPVADGGDGTAEIVLAAAGGRLVHETVTGPQGARIDAAYALLADRTAVVELAQASGLARVPPGRNDPLTASTRGTGELIAAAVAAGARRIILAVGGSATVDGGSGALAALGASFLDAEGNPVPDGGAGLARLARIELDKLRERLAGVQIEVACDVRNPLCGPHGAAAVYGPQKGASPEAVRLLEAALRRYADVLRATAGVDVRDVPGAGAAGGAAAGFMALAGAVLRPGAELVLDLLDFDRRLEGCALVVTGEGRLDAQTLAGKAPAAVAARARRQHIPVAAIAGSVECKQADLESAGIGLALPIVRGPITLAEAMRQAPELVEAAAETLAVALTFRPRS
jgi:glycerate kinase